MAKERLTLENVKELGLDLLKKKIGIALKLNLIGIMMMNFQKNK